ncbi:MAG: DUF6318 family protein [Nocardioides sp.]
MSAARVAASVAVALAAVSGCTSSAEPTPAPTPTLSSSPSESPSPSAAPPTMPAEAEGTSPRAAKAFARHYFDVINYAARTGDTRQLRKLGTSDCVSCEAIARNIEKIYGAGGHIESDGWRLTSVRNLQTKNGSAFLSLGVYLEAEDVISAAGHEPEHHDGRKQPMNLRLVNRAHGFSVSRLDLVS